MASSSSTSGEQLLMSGGRKTPEDLLLTSPTPDDEHEEDSVTPVLVLDDESMDMKELVKLVKNLDVKSGDSVNEIKLLRETVTSFGIKIGKENSRVCKAG